jgi:MoaA/NifB/PqqE/SkfB family radical SAM enzyme
MRFPIRLSASLLKAKIAPLAEAYAPPSIVHIASGENCVARARNVASPVVWLGGTEPLLDPEIGRNTNALVELDRHVFLHTDGYNLRQRIHAFRPDSRLFLTLEFAGGEENHNGVAGRPDAFRRSIEAIRAAKLSGFLIAAHVTVTPEMDACQIGELIGFLDKMDVDGFIVSSGGRSLADNGASLAENLADVRSMIRSGRWENFSRMLEASYLNAAPARAAEKVSASGENAFEEGD